MKALQFVLFPLVGAFMAWLVFEPWTEDYGYFRDLLLFFALAFFIVLSVLSRQGIRFRKWKLVKRVVTNKWVYIIPVIGAILIKLIFTQGSSGESTDCARDEERSSVILLLDISGSMDGEGINELKSAANTYFDLLVCADSKDQIACVTFDSYANLLFDFTSDYGKAVDLVKSLQPTGGTNMKLGFEEVYNLADRVETGPLSIILVSDGAPGEPDVVKDLVKSHTNIAVNTIGVGNGYNRDLLQGLSNISQGDFFRANDMESLTNVFQDIAKKQGGGITQVNQDGGEAIRVPIWKRILGWSLLGLFIGLAIGKVDVRPEMKAIATLGAVIGGFVSALVFVGLDGLAFDSGSYLRMISFSLYGAIIGLSIFFVNQIYSKAKIKNPFERKRSGPGT